MSPVSNALSNGLTSLEIVGASVRMELDVLDAEPKKTFVLVRTLKSPKIG